MKRVGFVLLLLVMCLGTVAMAQDTYFVTYFSNANTKGAPDGTVRIINDGYNATSCPDGNCNGWEWADFYVFDDSQEMIACCSCYISADGILSESVDQQLANPSGPTGPGVIGSTFSTRGEFTRGVIKIVGSSNSDPTDPVPYYGLHGWATHIQGASVKGLGTTGVAENSPYFVTEAPLTPAVLSSAELSSLGAVCSYGLQDNSGYGWCGCSPEDEDF